MSRYPAEQLELDLTATNALYRTSLDSQDQWTGFDDLRRARLRRLAGEVAEVVEELTAALG